jgi:hypothetical protein
MEYDELSKLPTAIYDAVVSSTDYGHSEILNDTVSNILTELEEDSDSYSFTAEEFTDEMRNILGEAFDMLLDGRLDFVSVIYD